MTYEHVPAIEVIKSMIEQIDHRIEIENVKYDFDRMEYNFLLYKDKRNCEIILSRSFLDDLNDYAGPKESKYWKTLEGSLKLRLSIPMQISDLIPFSSDIFFKEQLDWEQDDGRNIKVHYYADDYEIFQDGLKDLYHYLEEQKKSLSHLKLTSFPYDEDQKRIQEMLSYRNKQISENGPCPFRDSISVTSRKHLKAAALIRLLFYESELKQGHYTAAVKNEITARMVKILSLLSSPALEKIEIAEYLRGIKTEINPDQPKIFMSDDAQKLQYDVVISFAGEDRAYAERLAVMLKQDGFKVFYDKYEEADLWGKNLYEHLTEIYSKRGKYCVMFLSKHYATKQWPTLERRSAQEKAFKENKKYILPIRIDDTEIPGILDTVGYQDLRQKKIENIYEILKRILSPSTSPIPIEAETYSIRQIGLSDDAVVLLKLLSEKSKRALSNDPILKAEEVLGALQLSEEALNLAANELSEKGFVTLQKSLSTGKAGFRYIGTKEHLFSMTDKYLREWNPEKDSITLAKTLIDIAQTGYSASVQSADELLKWGPRRINPALFLLIDKDIVTPSKSVNPLYISMNVILKPRINRYIK